MRQAVTTTPRDLLEAAEQVADTLEPRTADVVDPMLEERRRLVFSWIAFPNRARVEDAAAAVALSSRTIGRHLHRAHWPSPKVVFRICRLFAAAFLIIFQTLPVYLAASETGFGPATMRHYMKAYFGKLPSELRTWRGGGLAAWNAMLEALPRIVRQLTPPLAILTTLAGGVVAQAPTRTAVSGRVVDAVSRTPLGGATVSLEGTAIATVTDADGRYRIDGAPSGPQVIRVIRIGYAPLRQSIAVPIAGTLTIDLGLAKSALNLPNLVVTADPAGRARGELGTASVIGSEAIRNQTAASLAGVLELIPGTVLQPPGLDGVQQFSLRAIPLSTGGGIGPNASGPSAQSLASFGTQIVLDGVPVSNNANLQSLGGRAELSFPTAAGGGIDLRRIPAATLERVEVIRGIPSARFGDLTQGVVVVDTRAGVVAPEFRFRLDARTTEGTIIGGTDLFPGQVGTATLNLARTRLAPGSTNNIGSRLSTQLAHRYTGRRLRLDTRLEGFQVLEDQPESPLFPKVASRSRDNGLRLSERARYQLGPRSRLEWTAAFEGDRQRAFSQLPLLRGAMPFTNRLTDGTQDGKFIGGIYVARVDVNGDPRQIYSRLELIAPTRFAGLDHLTRSGLELRREWNGGPGFQFDIEFPPQVTFNGVQGYNRPRRFDAVPPLVTSAVYLDDRISHPVGGTLINLQAGLRLDLLHDGSSWASGVRDAALGPRLQLEVAPAERLRFRAGVGRVSKVPSLADLSPGTQYYDLVNFNYFANIPAERRAIVTTRLLDRTNADLAMMRSDKAEVGIEFDLGRGGQISLAAYADRIRNGVGVRALPAFLIRDHFAVDSATIGTGRPPEVLQPPFLRDSVPTLIDQPANNLDLRSQGLELAAILPEIGPLKTRVDVQGAWSSSKLFDSGIQFNSAFSDFQLSEQVPRAPYWQALTRRGERLLVTTRLIHQQPAVGLVITGTVQMTLRESRQDIGGTDSLSFAGYITRGGALVPVPLADRAQPQYRDLRLTRNGLINPQTSPPDWLFSLQVSKTIPLDGRLSFYAFNAFDRQGNFGGATTVPRFYPPVRFGLEVTLPLLGVR